MDANETLLFTVAAAVVGVETALTSPVDSGIACRSDNDNKRAIVGLSGRAAANVGYILGRVDARPWFQLDLTALTARLLPLAVAREIPVGSVVAWSVITSSGTAAVALEVHIKNG